MPTLTPATAADLFRRAPDRFLDVGAGEVAYRRVGAGPDVLFVHGWPVSGATFRKLLPYLTEHLTCHLIDLPGAGDSRFDADTPHTVGAHIEAVRRVVDALELAELAVVGHDSGGLIARHALAGDRRVRAMGLIDTEQPQGLNRRLRGLLALRRLPLLELIFGLVMSREGLRRKRFFLGDIFADPSLLEGDFDELFLKPLHQRPERRRAAVEFLRRFDERYIYELADLHRRIAVPVQLVWGERDSYFLLAWAEEMAETFPDARLHIVEGARLFAHEERPEEVAAALLPTLLGSRQGVCSVGPSPRRFVSCAAQALAAPARPEPARPGAGRGCLGAPHQLP